MSKRGAWEQLEELCAESVQYSGGYSNCGEGAGHLLKKLGGCVLELGAHYYHFPKGFNMNTMAGNLGEIVGGDGETVMKSVSYAKLLELGARDATAKVAECTKNGKWEDIM